MNLLRSADRRSARQSIVVSGLVAALLLLAGLGFALLSKARWTAESVSVVLPGTTLSESDAAAYYETLSRGQIVATFAEVASNKRFEQLAERNLDLDAAQQASVSSEVMVAPSTSVVLIRVTSEDRQLAEQVVAEMTTVSQTYLQGLARPYRLEVINNGTGTSYRSSTSPLVLAAAALVVAGVGGVAVQQAVYHTLTALRSGSSSGGPGPAPDQPGDPDGRAVAPTGRPAQVNAQPTPAGEETAPVSTPAGSVTWWS